MLDYKKSGVDTHKAAQYIKDLKSVIQNTHKDLKAGKVVDNYGGFAGIFQLADAVKGGNLVATTDGVGTKIKLARDLGKVDFLGQDLVGMCVNDLYCVGATPLFFLDYIACGKLKDSWYHPVIGAIAAACRETSMALLGGETAEHPGVMADDDFDLAGFCVGIVPEGKHLPRFEQIQEGDILYAFPSNGLHSNGFSLVRKVLETIRADNEKEYQVLVTNNDWIEKILAPTRLYTFLPELTGNKGVKAVAHITGGGFYENIERVIPDGFTARIETPQPFGEGIFGFFTQYVEKKSLFSTFNMGTGIVVVATEGEADQIGTYGGQLIGKVVKGTKEKVLISGVDF